MVKWLVLGGCLALANVAHSAQITSIRTPGNLVALNPLACVSATSIGAESTAADIAVGIRVCIEESKYTEAVEMLMVASAYAKYDAVRVTDSSARAAATAVFSEHVMARISEESKEKTMAALSTFLENKSRSDELCAFLMNAPVPNYIPYYMIAHGLGVDEGESPMVEDLDTAEAWTEAMKFVRCVAR